MASAQPTLRSQYRPPQFWIDTVDLTFELHATATRVRAELSVRVNPEADGYADGTATDEPVRNLVLDGRELRLVSVALDGEVLGDERLQVTDETLVVCDVPERFCLQTEVEINPEANTALEGLYLSSGIFCTQCEAEGFRKITYFLDRPDVMARYTTTVIADPSRCPVLLSNGNPQQESRMDDGRSCVVWQDPFPKPSYLFALVAGDLSAVEDAFTTRSGRTIPLRIYVEAANIDKCDHALVSLKKAMRWDEEVYGREYDLDVFSVVAIDDFNMGAMENKGLNVFNARYVLADARTATDEDFANIEGVIAHEYFHNWTGNRVTCRDWFQLSLKEGLTVFRDQEFSCDVGSRAVQRIDDVQTLRHHQFSEDAGPMAHPVRPDSYVEINNFYTSTVYNKGAEVVRMIHTLLGPERFRRGTDLYFERHDGQAVTIEDFLAAMEDGGDIDLGQFRLWYSQAGTPRLDVERNYRADRGELEVSVRQTVPTTPGQENKSPMHIPLAVGLLGPEGEDLTVHLADGPEAAAATTHILHVRAQQETFRLTGLEQEPVLSLARGFSAPVHIEATYSDEDLAFLASHDRDPFSRWEAGQQMGVRLVWGLARAYRDGATLEVPDSFMETYARTLGDPALDPALRARALTLPSEAYIGERMDVIDVEAVHAARRQVREQVGRRLADELAATYRACSSDRPYTVAAEDIGRRSLRNVCLAYRMAAPDAEIRQTCLQQFEAADNMTDQLAALACFATTDCEERAAVLRSFEQQWRGDLLVLDKWFSAQATAPRQEALDDVRALTRHAAFDWSNPNRIRSLVGAFCMANPVRFHASDASGYRFLADSVLAIDPKNPQVAARLVSAFARWRRYDPNRAALMRAQLERIHATAGLSRDVGEIVSKSLA